MTDFFKVLDNAYGQINAGIINSDTSLILRSGEGARFPSNADNDSILTIIKWDETTTPATISKMERVTLTARTDDTLTLIRGYGGDTAQSFDPDDYVYLNLTQAVIEQIQNAINANEQAIESDVLRVDGLTALFNDTSFIARNSANSANISLFKLNSSDIMEFETLPRLPSSRVITHDNDLIDKRYLEENTSSGPVVESKDEASAVNGEIFENTDDSNVLSRKNTSGAVERLTNFPRIGVGTWTPTAISQTLTVTHNLGRVPSLIRINYEGGAAPSFDEAQSGIGLFDGTNYATLQRYDNASQSNSLTDTSSIIKLLSSPGSAASWEANITSNDANSFTMTVQSFTTSGIVNFNYEVR